MITPLNPENVASARRLIAAIGDAQERCLVQMVLDTRMKGGKLPGSRVMTPLMAVAAAALDGKVAPENRW